MATTKEMILETGSRVQDEENAWWIIGQDGDDVSVEGPFDTESDAVNSVYTFGALVRVEVPESLADLFGG